MSKEELMKKYPNLGLKQKSKLDANSRGDETDKSLVASVKNFFAPIRKKAPPKVREFVARNGNDKIITLEVGRTPINKPITGFLNTLSLGKYSKKKKELGYDNVYHTFLVATLESGKKIKIEKNSEVAITDYKPSTGELRHIPLKEPVPVSKFLEKGEKYFNTSDGSVSRGQNFWRYDKRTNNCQYFVDDLIRGNATEIAEAPEVSEPFRKQDSEELSKSLPAVSDSILNFKQRLDHAVSGDGLSNAGKALHDYLHTLHSENEGMQHKEFRMPTTHMEGITVVPDNPDQWRSYDWAAWALKAFPYASHAAPLTARQHLQDLNDETREIARDWGRQHVDENGNLIGQGLRRYRPHIIYFSR